MNSGDLVKSVIKLSLIALLIFVLYKLKLGLLYVFIALILTLIVNPLNKLFFKKLKLSKTFSSVISITFLISFFAIKKFYIWFEVFGQVCVIYRDIFF